MQPCCVLFDYFFFVLACSMNFFDWMSKFFCQRPKIFFSEPQICFLKIVPEEGLNVFEKKAVAKSILIEKVNSWIQRLERLFFQNFGSKPQCAKLYNSRQLKRSGFLGSRLTLNLLAKKNFQKIILQLFL